MLCKHDVVGSIPSGSIPVRNDKGPGDRSPGPLSVLRCGGGYRERGVIRICGPTEGPNLESSSPTNTRYVPARRMRALLA
ncbi:MAG: hypothetical protein JWN65_3173 [Solirubrobacterales bacterium]|nr:hypothetical protein [Solirubrobacterales bacterium]